MFYLVDKLLEDNKCTRTLKVLDTNLYGGFNLEANRSSRDTSKRHFRDVEEIVSVAERR